LLCRASACQTYTEQVRLSEIKIVIDAATKKPIVKTETGLLSRKNEAFAGKLVRFLAAKNEVVRVPIRALLPIAKRSRPVPMKQNIEVPSTEGIKSKTPENATVPRLAYSMTETADLLGISYISCHRLLKRGLLRSSSALRIKLIPHSEIERFLKTTLQ
jgi:hypothetical protein